jgi:uncharacterized membrane protein
MTRKILFWLVAFHATFVGLYPSVYLFMGRHYGILQSKSDAVLNNAVWNTEFYLHIISGGVALLLGWMQFNVKWRTNRVYLHRLIGKVYIVAVLLSAEAAVYIAFYAQGGAIAASGFICMGAIWFYTTSRAYLAIIKKHTEDHQKMMTYSYATCFAAVTLRMYLFPLSLLLHDFIKAYQIVAWLCWIPNLIVAYFINKRLSIPAGLPAGSSEQ